MGNEGIDRHRLSMALFPMCQAVPRGGSLENSQVVSVSARASPKTGRKLLSPDVSVASEGLVAASPTPAVDGGLVFGPQEGLEVRTF